MNQEPRKSACGMAGRIRERAEKGKRNGQAEPARPIARKICKSLGAPNLRKSPQGYANHFNCGSAGAPSFFQDFSKTFLGRIVGYQWVRREKIWRCAPRRRSKSRLRLAEQNRREEFIRQDFVSQNSPASRFPPAKSAGWTSANWAASADRALTHWQRLSAGPATYGLWLCRPIH